MKFKYAIYAGVLAIACFILVSFKMETKVNYKVEKAINVSEVRKSALSLKSNLVQYFTTCPDGSSGCGSGSGPQCSGTECDAPSPVYRQANCISQPGYYSCSISGSTAPVCGTQAPSTCPNNPPNPTKSRIPCEYGSPSYGCFSGWVSGPGCTALVNCTPPPN